MQCGALDIENENVESLQEQEEEPSLMDYAVAFIDEFLGDSDSEQGDKRQPSRQPPPPPPPPRIPRPRRPR
jgi:hypothetical protein